MESRPGSSGAGHRLYTVHGADPAQSGTLSISAEVELGGYEIELEAEEVEFGGEEVDFGGNEIELEADEVEFGGNEIELEANEIELEADEVEFGGNEIELEASEIELEANEVELGGNEVELVSNKVTLELLRNEVPCIKNEVQPVRIKAPCERNKVQPVRNKVSLVKTEVQHVRNEVPLVRNEVPCVKKEVLIVRNEVPCVKKEVTFVRNEVPSCVKKEVPLVKKEVPFVRNQVYRSRKELEREIDEENPWPYLVDYFGYKHRNGNSFIMRCKLCLPIETELSAYKNSTSNLRKHIERKHPTNLKAYCDFVAARRRNMEVPVIPSKQAKITEVAAVGENRCMLQTKDDKLIVNFVCEGLHPFSVVDQPAFKEFLQKINSQCKVISSSDLQARIEGAASQMKHTLMSHLSKASYVATTADCWTAQQQSYVMVTAHWIDEETLKRKSAALACKRFRESHTFDDLAGVLDEIYGEYRIREKLVRITTDSGSNFVNAMGEQNQLDEAESDKDSSENPKADYLDTFSILEQESDLEYEIPLRQRCACHLITLVATTDAAMAEETSVAYKRLSRAVFGKCQAIWDNSGRTAATVEHKGKLQLIWPNQTQWNSTYMAVERLVQIIQEKGEDAIRNLCEELKVKMLKKAEIEFLTEYCTVMKPVVKVLNTLQSDTSTFMGWLLPVIYKLQTRLKRLSTSSKTCLPLVRALQDGVQKRFGMMMEDPELIAASILLPKFKTTWTERADIIETGLAYVRQHLDQMAKTRVTVKQHSSDDDFFSSMNSKRSQGTVELDGYLACASSKIDLLRAFPNIKQLSLKLNTALPASATCDGLSNCSGLLTTAKQAGMNSANFENQLLLKINNKFID